MESAAAGDITGPVLAVMIAETHAAADQIREDTEAIRNMVNFVISVAALGFYAWLLWTYRGSFARLLTGWAAGE